MERLRPNDHAQSTCAKAGRGDGTDVGVGPKGKGEIVRGFQQVAKLSDGRREPLKPSPNLLSSRSLSCAVDEHLSGLVQFKSPAWMEVVGLVTRAAALTEISSIGQLNIGMALSTEASNHS